MIDTQRYYEHYSATYEARRHHGYHQLIDDLEVEIAREHCRGRVLEAGCGTGLILRRLAIGAERAIGVDLSYGMLRPAGQRGLDVAQGTIAALPFAANTFDAVVSFKTLAHVPDLAGALGELGRVTRPGGALVLELYNRYSLRRAIKRLAPAGRIGRKLAESDVYTRYDSLDDVRAALPPSLTLELVHGVRVFTPFSRVHDVPVLRSLIASAERAAVDAPLLRRLGGFLVVVLRKRSGARGDAR